MTKQNKDDKRDFGVPLNRFSLEKCEKIHAASLELLHRVGARIHLEEAIQILKKAGTKVIDGNLVRIPSHLVDKALATAPKKIDLFDRYARPALNLGQNNQYYGPGSDCLNIIDYRNGHRRRPIVKDVKEGTILCDSLENIDFVMSMVLPSDVNQSIADRFQMEVMLNHTTKPIIFVSYDLSGCKDCVEMAEVVMGGAETLQKKPLVTCYINVPTGLLHNEDSLGKLLFLAEKANLEGKIGAAYGAFGWSGEAPGRIYGTMENIFKMKMVKEPLMLKSSNLGGGIQMAQDYGRQVAKLLTTS